MVERIGQGRCLALMLVLVLLVLQKDQVLCSIAEGFVSAGGETLSACQMTFQTEQAYILWAFCIAHLHCR